MKLLYKILLLALIDLALIWLMVYYMNPDPSSSIWILILVPLAFLINAIIAAYFFFKKKVQNAKAFLVNAVIASLLMYYLFGRGVDRYQNERLESWEFENADTTFRVTRWKKRGEFSMSYSLVPGSSSGLLNGECKGNKGEWKLTADSLEMKISGNKLIGFRFPTDTIHMTKLER